MMDTKDGDRKGKTLGVRSGGTETSHVRQSFSHGRTKSVTVEHKRKRILVPKPGAPAGQQPGRPGGTTPNLSDVEFERRLKAVEAAKAQEAERRQKEIEATQAREAELARLRAEKDAAERAAREKEIAEQRAAAAAAEAEAEAARATQKKSAAPQGREAPAAPVDPAAAQAIAARAEAGRPTGPKKVGDKAPAVEEKRTRGKGEDDRRRSGKLTIANATDEEGRQRSLAAMKRRQERDKRRTAGHSGEREKVVREVHIPDAITVQELANRMAERVAAVVKTLMQNGIMATQNQTIDPETAALIVEEFGHKVVRVSESDVEDVITLASGDDARQAPAASGRRDHHGPRRPRQDLAARRDPQDQRRLRRGRRHHPAHRRLPGEDAERRARHLPRHAGPRRLHLDARPRRAGDGHRRAGRRRRRQRHAADHRGHQPCQGGGRADHRRDQQGRQERRRPEPGAHPAPQPRDRGRGDSAATCSTSRCRR